MHLTAWWCGECLVMTWDQEEPACPLCQHSMTETGWQESPEKAPDSPSEALAEAAGS